MRLTKKQETFCRRYVEQGDARAAARSAGYGNSRMAAKRNLANPAVLRRIEALRQGGPEELHEVAAPEEILEFLTEVMRGTVSPRQDDVPKVSERTRAAELLGRNQRLFGESKGLRREQPACVVRIWGEDELAD